MSKRTLPKQNVQCSPENLIFIQSRAEINFSIVDEYAAMMTDGVEFDPVEGVQDESRNVYVWDGFHRGEAAKKTGTTLAVNIQPGTKQDAEWLALTANQKHGLRRSRADKQRVVRQALLHPYGVNLSNREIARHCGVSDKTVGKIRSEMEASAEIPQIENRLVTRGGKTYEQDTRNIGGQADPKSDEPGNRTLTSDNSDYDTCPEPIIDQSIEHKPQSQEFECPRCGQEKIVGVNGSRRWCLNCGAEWSTAVDFLEEAKAKRSQMTRSLTQEHVQSRFSDILARLEGQEEQLAQVNIWLDELERRLALPENNAAVDDVPELITWPMPVQVLENA